MKHLNRLLTFAVLLSGSTNILAVADTDATAMGSLPGMQLALGPCLVAKPPTPSTQGGKEKLIADAIAGTVITAGVNYLGKALTAAGASKTWTITSSRNLQTTSDAFPNCVLVVRGTFVTVGTSKVDWTAPVGWPSTLPSELGNRGVWLSGAPDFIFEGEFITSVDKTAMTIRPIIASYTRPIGTRTFRWGDERNVALFFAITPPGTKPTLDNAPAATVILGELTPSRQYRYESSTTYSSPYESPWFSISKADVVRPLTVTAMVSETQGENEFLSFLGTTFSDSRVTAAETTQLSQILIPSVGRQAAADNAAKSVTAANDADSKFGLAISKLNACKVAGDAANVATAGADARSALRNFMIADSLSPTPSGLVTQSMVDQIDLTQQSNAIKVACTKVLSSITRS
ncbi:hypothetical protein [Burkholderia sp. KJ006]|uniref:hypothetical protein n=1 Tax=Burkholderia sp. KJ006 TaxID=416344 RepID=UPI0011D1D23C|nr:hypothetical protein [Burkholderia sp. KJ006]